MGSSPVGISASRGSAVLGQNKYKTQFVAWLEIMEQVEPGFCEKNNYLKPERVDPFAEPLDPKLASLRWGLAFEDAICDLVGDVTDREKLFTHSDHEWLTCHIDGIKNGRLQENKTAFIMAYEKGWGEPGTDEIPLDYQIQIQHQMMCAEITEIDVNVLIFPIAPAKWEAMGFKIVGDQMYLNGSFHMSLYSFAMNLKNLGYFKQYHVKANEETQATLLKDYTEFWETNVLKQVEPIINDDKDIKWLIASPEGEIEADDSIKDLFSEYCDIDEEIKSSKNRMFEIKGIVARWIQLQVPKDSAEKGKLRVFAGAKNIVTVSKAKPSIKVSKSTAVRMKDDYPALYEKMKHIKFTDFLGDLTFTEKQKEALDKLNEEQKEILKPLIAGNIKFLNKFKMTKILDKENIVSKIESKYPEIHKSMFECGVIEETDPHSSIRINK